MQDATADALKAAHESIGERADIPFEDFRTLMDGWDVIPIRDSGEIIGAVMVNGNEVHVGLKRQPIAPHRRELREILGRLLRNGEVFTRVQIGCEHGLQFCKRLGFDEFYRDERVIYLKCKESRYGR